jgi:tetratricopeptide (TPR) repeat protein
MKRILWIVLAVCMFPAALHAGTNSVEDWEALAARHRDARIFFNLGAAYSASGNTGKAVLNLKRAALLAPSDRIASALLASEREKLGFPRHFFDSPLIESIILFPFSFAGTNVTAAIGIFLFAAGALFLAFLFSRLWKGRFRFPEGPHRNRFFTAGWIALAAGGVLLISSVVRESAAMNPGEAVILAESSLRVTPKDGAEILSDLPEGMECRVIRTDGSWYLLRTVTGQEGWFPSAFVGRLWPETR